MTDALSAAVPGDRTIAVVVLPEDADLGTVYPLELLDRLSERVPQTTVVLAVGDDLQAGSTVIDSNDVLRIANENEAAAGGNTQTALVETVQQIVEENPSSPGWKPGEGPTGCCPS